MSLHAQIGPTPMVQESPISPEAMQPVSRCWSATYWMGAVTAAYRHQDIRTTNAFLRELSAVLHPGSELHVALVGNQPATTCPCSLLPEPSENVVAADHHSIQVRVTAVYAASSDQ